MKKLILSLAFVLAISSSAVNASSSDEMVLTTSTENFEIVKDLKYDKDLLGCMLQASEGATIMAIWLNLDVDEEHDVFIDLLNFCMN